MALDNLFIYIILSSAFAILPIARASQCYNPDGTTPKNDFYPCNGTAEVTHCCSDAEACLSNGLCFMKWDTSVNTGLCTDQSWANSACFQPCLECKSIQSDPSACNSDFRIAKAIGKIEDLSTLYRCSGNEWCCSAGGNTTSCCPENKNLFRLSTIAEIENGTNIFAKGYTIAPSEVLATSSLRIPSTTSTSLSSTSLGSTSQSSNVPPVQTQRPTSISPTPASTSTLAGATGSDNSKVTVGLGAGLGIGLPLLLALAGTGFLLRRERRINQDLRRSLSSMHPKLAYPGDQKFSSGPLQELPDRLPNELIAQYQVPELSNAR